MKKRLFILLPIACFVFFTAQCKASNNRQVKYTAQTKASNDEQANYTAQSKASDDGQVNHTDQSKAPNDGQVYYYKQTGVVKDNVKTAGDNTGQFISFTFAGCYDSNTKGMT